MRQNIKFLDISSFSQQIIFFVNKYIYKVCKLNIKFFLYILTILKEIPFHPPSSQETEKQNAVENLFNSKERENFTNWRVSTAPQISERE